MHSTFVLSFILSLSCLGSAAILPLAPKGGGGGGGRGGGGGGRSSSGSGRSTGASRGGSGDTGHPAISYGGVNTGNRNANYFGGGGGRPVTLSDASIFHGRQMGGGIRSEVPGTRAFGSGYPYSAGDIKRVGVAGQPFPFGFWPIYWSTHGHSDEYGANSTVAAQRPGGEQVLVELIPNPASSTWNTTTINGVNETYWMIGDKESVTTLLSILADSNALYTNGCGVQNLTIESFNSTDPQEPVQFENVIQWYRSSSFALAYQGYNNSNALLPLNETTSLEWAASTPLPDQLQYSPFLQCINSTISAALPILDQEGPLLSSGQIAGIVIGSIFGALFLCCCVIPCVCAARRNRQELKRQRERQLAFKRTLPQRRSALDTSELKSNSEKPSPSSWPTVFPSQPSDSYSQRSSYASSTTRPGSALLKQGHESFYSSRTMIEVTAKSQKQDGTQPLYYK